MSKQYRLLIETTDQKGLVHSISGVILAHDLNIEQNSEFVEQENNRFFMRTEFSGEVDEAKFLADIYEVLPSDRKVELVAKRKKRVVMLVTKEHHCMGDLLMRNHYDEIAIDVVAVVSNYDDLKPLATGFGLPYHFVSHENHTRESHEDAVMAVIDQYSPDYIVLAKYMRILTPKFVGAYNNRIINIHHSFLPAFIGASPYKQAYDRGVKIIGATAHFVNNDLDEGPIIAQGILPVNHSYSAEEMARSGKDVEKQVLAKALKLVFDDRVFIYKNRTVIFD